MVIKSFFEIVLWYNEFIILFCFFKKNYINNKREKKNENNIKIFYFFKNFV